MRHVSALASILLATLSAGQLAAGGVEVQPLAVEGHFTPGDDASELSGMDCLTARADGSRLCLVVDDEGDFAQFATLSRDRLTVGAVQPLFDATSTIGKPPGELLGKPGLDCSRGLDPGEVDGEAVAHSGKVFLVVGSHGCSKNRKYRPETFLLARITVDDQDKVTQVENSYRLSEAIRTIPQLAAAFGTDLPPRANGTSIEAMAVRGDELVIGFRSPAKDEALLLLVPIADLFDADAVFTTDNVKIEPIALAPSIGFRDIEALPDGSFLALTGPDGEADPDQPYALRTIDKNFELGRLDVPLTAPGDGSPEAIELHGDEAGRQSVVMLSDGSADGGPLVVRFDKPQ